MYKVILVLVLTLSLVGCSTQERYAGGGALLGAGTGAVVGGLAGGPRAAVLGAAIGAGAGTIVGAAAAPRECWARDRQGYRVRVRC